MNNQKIRQIFYIVALILGILILSVVSVKYILPMILPFLIGWGIAFLVRPAARFASGKTKIPERVVSPIFAVLLLLLGIGLISAVVLIFASEGIALATELISGGELQRLIELLLNPIGGLTDKFPEELAAGISEAVGSFIGKIASTLAELVTSIISGVPGILFFLLITLISTVYFCSDLENINKWVVSRLPSSVRTFLISFKRHSLSVALKYVKSYLIIMLVTFALMLIGFSILRVEYAFLLSTALALLDALPLFGVGTVLVPYSIISFALGDVGLGIGLLVLLMVNEIARQLIEPKILGKSLGLHPLITIVLLYAGYSLFGITGVLLLPIFSVVINSFIKGEAEGADL